MSRIKFLNTEVDNLTMNEAVQKIEQLILNKKTKLRCYTKCRSYS